MLTFRFVLRVVAGLQPAGTPVVRGRRERAGRAGGFGGGFGDGDGLGDGDGDGDGDGSGSSSAAATLTLRTVLSYTPSSSVTVNRTRLTPTFRNVNRSVSPVPSVHWVPPEPSGPSSCQR